MQSNTAALSASCLQTVLNTKDQILTHLLNPFHRHNALGLALNDLADLFSSGNCAFFRVVKNDPGLMELVASSNRWWQHTPGSNVRLPTTAAKESGLTAWSATQTAPVRLNHDAINASAYKGQDSHRTHLGGHSLFSFLAIPITGFAGEFYGLLKFENKLDHNNTPSPQLQFTLDDERMAVMLANTIVAVDSLQPPIAHNREIAMSLTRHMHSHATWADVLKSLIEKTVRLLNADRGDFAWWIASTGGLAYAVQYGPSTNKAATIGQPVPLCSFVRAVFMETEVDYRLNNNVCPSDTPYYELHDSTKSEIAVRIDLNGNPVGVLNVESFKPHAFSIEEHLPMLRDLAVHAALVVQKTQRDRLIQSAIEHEGPPETILQPILEGVMESCGFDAGILYRHDKNSDTLNVAASHHPPSAKRSDFDPRHFTHSLHKPSFARCAFELPGHSDVLILRDPANHESVDKEALMAWNIKSDLVGYPISFRGRNWGCFVLWTCERNFPRVLPTPLKLNDFARMAAAKIAYWEAQQQIAEQQYFYEALSDSSPLYVVTKRVTTWKSDDQPIPEGVDPKIKFEYEWANQSFRNYVKARNLKEIRGQTDWNFFPPDHALQYYRGDLDALLTGSVTEQREVIIAPKDNKPRHIVVWKKAFDVPGRPRHLHVVFWDRTREEEIDSERQHLLEEKETLIRDIIHRVKNCFYYAHDIVSDDLRNIAHESDRRPLEQCCLRLAYSEMLLTHLYQRGVARPVSMRAFLTQVVELVRRSMEPQSPLPGVEVQIDIDDSATFNEKAAQYCALILTELVANAYRHAFPGPLGGTIVVELNRSEQQWRLIVRDDGVGVKGPTSIRTPTRGLGLVERLVRHLGGTFEIDPIDPFGFERGTTCCVKFHETTKGHRPNVTLAGAQSQAPTVLIVEDEVVQAVRLETILKEDGFHVVGTVSTVEDATRLIKNLSPSVVLADICLGDSKSDRYAGLDLWALTQHESPGVPFVMMTHVPWNDTVLDERMASMPKVPLIVKSVSMGDQVRLEVRKALLSRIEGKSIFVCYSHQDTFYCEELLKHLRNLSDLQVWSDHMIEPGDEWKSKIAVALRSSIAAVLLVSADFQTSPFIQQFELPVLLRRANARGTIIIPIMLLRCDTRVPSGENLADFQFVANTITEPVAKRERWEQQEVWYEVRRKIEQTLGVLGAEGELRAN